SPSTTHTSTLSLHAALPISSHSRHGDARDPYRPALRAEHPEKQAHERGLPRSVQANERVYLAPAHLEVEVEDARRGRELPRDPLDPQHFSHPRSRPPGPPAPVVRGRASMSAALAPTQPTRST